MSIPPRSRIRWPEAATALVRPVGSIDPAVAFRSGCQLRNLRGRGEWRKKKKRGKQTGPYSGPACGKRRGVRPKARISAISAGAARPHSEQMRWKKVLPESHLRNKEGPRGGLRPLREPFCRPPGGQPGAGRSAARSGHGAWKRRARRFPAGPVQRRISWPPGLPAVRRGPGGRARCAWRIPNDAWRSSARPSDNPPAAPISGGSRPATCRRSSADSA